MNSSPTSGASTGLCRWTFGSPGMLPINTSSIEGCSAAVMETVSPSQLRPAVNHRMCTSFTADGRGENFEGEAIYISLGARILTAFSCSFGTKWMSPISYIFLVVECQFVVRNCLQ